MVTYDELRFEQHDLYMKYKSKLEEQCEKEALLQAEPEDNAWYRCTVCGREGTVGRCCGDETRLKITKLESEGE